MHVHLPSKILILIVSMFCILQIDVVEILGEGHIAVMRSAHRTEMKQYREAMERSQEQGGGIMNGSGLSSNKSIFNQETSGSVEDEYASGIDALSMLEEGAVSYDGSSIPMGEEVEGDTVSFSSSQKSREKANS